MRIKSSNSCTMLLFSLFHGGAEKVCLTLCNELVNKNYDINLWLVDSTETSLTHKLDDRVIISELNKKHVRNSFFKLAKLFIQQKPETVIVFHIELAILAILIKIIFFQKTKIIVRSNNTLSHSFKNKRNSLKNRIIMHSLKYILPQSNKIIAQSTGMKNDLIKYFELKEEKITTIFNPASLISDRVSIFSRQTHHDNEFLFVGRLCRQKGIKNLIKIFKMALVQNPNLSLTIVGEGPEEKDLKELVNSLNLNSSICFEGYNPDIIQYYKRSKATLLTSIHEGFPNVLVESIKVGTPVIAFDCPSGPEDIIIQGVNGILVKNLDFNSFCHAILTVASGSQMFNKQEIINSSKKFSIEKIRDSYERVLHES